LGRYEDGLGFGEEVELAFAWDAAVSSKCQPKGEASQLVVGEAVDGGKQNILGGLLVVLVVPAKCLATSSVRV
jgi:hypothetical protein